MRTISASELKAKCFALLDEVSRTGESITVLKRGKPVAQIVRPVAAEGAFPQESLRGTGHICGDLIEPPLDPEAWDANRGKL
ncbi:MAG TPA: type II toxin-antitoxin system Phd/YefM family antitoxin [Kofleriaceae bacterium]|nr:type II toxin-antitoxin system Phd/YefM family antitoxin [Kofleriaceae bacterium]